MSNSSIGAKTGGIVVLIKNSVPIINYYVDITSTFIIVEIKCYNNIYNVISIYIP